MIHFIEQKSLFGTFNRFHKVFLIDLQVGSGGGTQTGVSIVIVSVITLFPGLYKAVSTTSRDTGGQTIVFVAEVSVVTELHTRLNEAIAARGGFTGIQTSIIVALISVITELAQLEDSIPAF